VENYQLALTIIEKANGVYNQMDENKQVQFQPRWAMLLVMFSEIYFKAGEIEIALNLLRNSLPIKVQSIYIDPNTNTLLITLNSLFLKLIQLGKFEEALDVSEKIVTYRKNIYFLKNIQGLDYALSLCNHAQTLVNLFRVEESKLFAVRSTELLYERVNDFALNEQLFLIFGRQLNVLCNSYLNFCEFQHAELCARASKFLFEKLEDESGEPHEIDYAWCLLGLGRSLLQNVELSEPLEILNQSAKLYESIFTNNLDKKMALYGYSQAFINLSKIYASLGDCDKSSYYSEKAIGIVDEFSEIEKAGLFFEQSLSFFECDQIESALISIDNALLILESIKKKQQNSQIIDVLYAEFLCHKTTCLRLAENNGDALYAINKAIEIMRPLQNVHPHVYSLSLGRFLCVHGSILSEMNEIDQAINTTIESIKIIETNIGNMSRFLKIYYSISLNYLSDYYYIINEPIKAFELNNRASEYLKHHDMENVKLHQLAIIFTLLTKGRILEKCNPCEAYDSFKEGIEKASIFFFKQPRVFSREMGPSIQNFVNISHQLNEPIDEALVNPIIEKLTELGHWPPKEAADLTSTVPSESSDTAERPTQATPPEEQG
jgi:tetratricopeptide (TPR) repeat protein